MDLSKSSPFLALRRKRLVLVNIGVVSQSGRHGRSRKGSAARQEEDADSELYYTVIAGSDLVSIKMHLKELHVHSKIKSNGNVFAAPAFSRGVVQM